MRFRRSALAALPFVFASLVACGGGSEPVGFGAAADGGAASTPGSGGNGGPPASSDAGVFGVGDGASVEAGACEDAVDVVFVLDVSSSMDFILDKLDAEIDKVVTAANALKSGAHFGLVAFVDNYKVDVSGPLEGGKVHTDGATLKAAFEDYKKTYTFKNRNPGDGPNGPTTQNPICEEDAVDALHAAAAEFPWRASATRVVIVVTDDTFLERPDNYGDRDHDGKEDKTDYPREGNYPAQWTMAEAVGALKEARVRVFSFTRLTPPGELSLQRCGTGRRLPWSSITDGWTTPYDGQTPIPTATSGKNFDLDGVRTGSISLSDTINEVVVGSYCNPPPR